MDNYDNYLKTKANTTRPALYHSTEYFPIQPVKYTSSPTGKSFNISGRIGDRIVKEPFKKEPFLQSTPEKTERYISRFFMSLHPVIRILSDFTLFRKQEIMLETHDGPHGLTGCFALNLHLVSNREFMPGLYLRTIFPKPFRDKG